MYRYCNPPPPPPEMYGFATKNHRRVFPGGGEDGAVLPACTGQRLLHFEKVDWNSTVWVNGERVCSHVGGYDHFTCPMPAFSGPAAARPLSQQLELVVGVVDYTELNPHHWQPEGKQVRSAFTQPSGMMYVPLRPTQRWTDERQRATLLAS